MDKFEKQEYEEFVIAGEYEDVMTTGETITDGTSTVTAIDKDGNDVSSTILEQSTKTVDGTQLQMRCKAGTYAASPYQITFKAVMSTLNKWEVDVIMWVKEI